MKEKTGQQKYSFVFVLMCLDGTSRPPPSSNSGFSYLIFHLLSSANKCVKKCRGLVERAYS